MTSIVNAAVQGALAARGMAPQTPLRPQVHHSAYVQQQVPQGAQVPVSPRYAHPGQIGDEFESVDQPMLFNDDVFNQQLCSYEITKECVNLIPIRSINLHVAHSLKVKIWQWQYINLALMLKRSPHERMRRLPFIQNGQICVQEDTKDVENFDEWRVAIRLYFITLLQSPALGVDVKAKLALNMLSYVDFISNLSSHGDWKYYDEQYRVYLSTSDDGPKGLAFGSYDTYLLQDAERLGVPAFKTPSSAKKSSHASSDRKARIKEAYRALEGHQVQKGFCWLHQANLHCEGPPSCRFLHECSCCRKKNHGLLTCRSKVSQQPNSSGAVASGGAQPQPQGFSPYLASVPVPGAPQLPAFSFPPPTHTPPPAPSPQQLTFSMTPPRYNKDKFWTSTSKRK